MEAAEEKEDSKKNNVKQTKRKTDKRKDKSMASGKAFMYETIYNDLLEGIRNGTYPAGSRLPSEKELAGQYGVSRIIQQESTGTSCRKRNDLQNAGTGIFRSGNSSKADCQVQHTTDTGNKRADAGDSPDREDHWRDPGQF